MKQSVYIETTIVSYLTAWPSRDLVRTAQQQVTRDWWERRRAIFDLYSAETVVLEASAGDKFAAAERLSVLRDLPLLDITEQVQALARTLVAEAAVPLKEVRDAAHIAVAACHGIDFLLTWNCRHLANASMRRRIEQVCARNGLRAPIICTPEELMGGES